MIYTEIIVLSSVILLVAAAVFAERWIAKLILVKEIEKEPPIIISAYFDSDNKGTFMYYLGNQGLIKISDHILHSPSYNEDRTKVVGVIEENGFSGIGELDLSDNSFREVLDLEELNEFAENNRLKGLDLSDKYLNVEDRLRVAKYYKNSYTFIYDGNICMLSDKKGNKQIKIIRKKMRESYVKSYYIDENNKNILLSNEKASVTVRKLKFFLSRALSIEEEYDKNIEDEKLEKAIEKNIKKEENKLIQYLVRQGFSLNKILSKYKEFKENNDLEGE